MERVLKTEQYFRLEREKVQKLEEELKWQKAKAQALQLDLDRWTEKNSEWAKEMVQAKNLGQDWPKANSYWLFEGPKLKERVLQLESDLERVREKMMWSSDQKGW